MTTIQVENDAQARDLALYDITPPEERAAMQVFIQKRIVSSSRGRRTAYGLKQAFTSSPDGFYVYEGQFLGALLAAGFKQYPDGHFRVRLLEK